MPYMDGMGNDWSNWTVSNHMVTNVPESHFLPHSTPYQEKGVRIPYPASPGFEWQVFFSKKLVRSAMPKQVQRFLDIIIITVVIMIMISLDQPL